MKIANCSEPWEVLDSNNQEFVINPAPRDYAPIQERWDVRCKVGFMWSNSELSKEISCKDSKWNDFPSKCIRTYLFISLFF